MDIDSEDDDDNVSDPPGYLEYVSLSMPRAVSSPGALLAPLFDVPHSNRRGFVTWRHDLMYHPWRNEFNGALLPGISRQSNGKDAVCKSPRSEHLTGLLIASCFVLMWPYQR